jgi:hypothetical protein
LWEWCARNPAVVKGDRVPQRRVIARSDIRAPATCLKPVVTGQGPVSSGGTPKGGRPIDLDEWRRKTQQHSGLGHVSRHTAASAADQAASTALDAGAVRGYDGAVGGLGSGLGRWTLCVLRRWRLVRATFAGDSSGRGDGCGDEQGGEGGLVVARKDAARTSMEDSGSFVVVLMSTPRSLIPDRVATGGQRPAAPSTEVPRVRNGPLTGDRGRLASARPRPLLLPAERPRAGGTGCTRRVCASAGPGPSARRRH